MGGGEGGARGEEGGRRGGGGRGRGTRKGGEGREREEGSGEGGEGGGNRLGPAPGAGLSASRPAPRMLSSGRLLPMHLAVCAAVGLRATPGRWQRRAARTGSGPRHAVLEGGGRRGSQERGEGWGESGRDGKRERGKKGGGWREGDEGGEGDGGREVRAKKEGTSGSAFLHKKKQNNVYLIVLNQAHEQIRQKVEARIKRNQNEFDIWLLTILA